MKNKNGISLIFRLSLVFLVALLSLTMVACKKTEEGHTCSYKEHISYSMDEDVDNDTFVVYRTAKCSCGEIKTVEFTGYSSVIDTAGLRRELISNNVKNRLIVMNSLGSYFSYGRLEIGLDYLDEGLTIIAREGVTMAGIVINSAKGSNNANASEDVMPSGVIIRGITFTSDLKIYNCSIDSLTIEDCTFTNGASIEMRANSYDGSDENHLVRPLYQRNTISNTTIENCTFEGQTGISTKTKIAVYDMDGITIRNNNFSSCEYNAIQLNDRSFDGVLGEIVIEGNIISETYSRAIRITAIKGNITVKNNTFAYINLSGADNGQIFKASSTEETTVIVFAGNTLDNQPIEVNDPKVVWGEETIGQ